jgi:hypothetical protein
MQVLSSSNGSGTPKFDTKPNQIWFNMKFQPSVSFFSSNLPVDFPIDLPNNHPIVSEKYDRTMFDTSSLAYFSKCYYYKPMSLL